MREETFDVVVIGGGATGTGCALDAATRGLSVALLEARDFASGTSSRSSKLIHGGLRYLEQMDFGLVREALRERGLLLNVLAPHLVRPVPFLYPLEQRVWQRAYVGAGMLLYDQLGGHKGLHRHRHLTKRQALRIAPALKPDALIGAIQYWDAQVDDARHTLTVARTAASYGAAVAIERARRRLPARGRARDRRARARRPRRRGVRHPGAPGDQRDRRLDRRRPGPGRRARQVQGPRLQGHPPRRPARPRPDRHRADPAHREERAVRDPVGPPLDHRHDRHRLGARQGPSGRQRAATSTTCSSTRTRCSPSRSGTRTSRASTPACGRCSPASPRTRASSAASTPSRCRCRG